MASRGRRLLASESAIDLRVLVEAAAVIAATWLVLGWTFTRAITQADGSVLVVPFTQSALRAGIDWTDHLYRFGVVGGSKLHDFAGSLPVIQLCSALGVSTTATVNLVTMFLQLGFGFFGIKAIEAMIAQWMRTPRFRLSAPQRIAAIWLCSFAPVLGWRLAYGHENLLLGLLPVYTAIALLWAARAGTLTVVALGFAGFVVCNGVSGLGPQTLVYSAVFGAPLVVATIAGAPRGARWGRPQWAVAGVMVASVLVMLPRLAGMIDHALGEDASRGLGDAVVYSYGSAAARDWLTSIPWTEAVATGPPGGRHEHNFPVGPIVVFVALLWPRGTSRGLIGALAAGAALAIAVASDIAPLSTLLLELVPPLQAFRVPARAILPIVVFVPSLALAVCWLPRGPAAPDSARVHWLAVAIGAVVILGGRGVPPLVREAIAWLGCLAIAGLARWRPQLVAQRSLTAAVAVVAALGVAAFDERFPRGVAFDPVEHGPRRIRDAVLAQAPEVAMPLNRIQIADPPPPYDMSTAFAAGLPTLDGVWYPPRRFLELLGTLNGAPLPPTACVFALTRSRAYPVLQQLYNVRYVVSLRDGALHPQPDSPGAAWFPRRIATIDRGAELAAALSRADLRAQLTATAWLLRSDADRVPAFTGDCAATVTGVTTDEHGQTATITVAAPQRCPLVVATSYVSTFRATATVAGATREVAVFPVNIALTGIDVPAGATTVTLGPVARIPWWSRGASLLGVAMACGALIAAARSRQRD